jgi:hypothetical protein
MRFDVPQNWQEKGARQDLILSATGDLQMREKGRISAKRSFWSEKGRYGGNILQATSIALVTICNKREQKPLTSRL